MKVIVVTDSGRWYYRPFEQFGTFTPTTAKLEYACGLLEKHAKSISLVVFTGGEDIDPSMYGDAKLYLTHSNVHRDLFEKHVFKKALSLGLPMIGICRGAQFLCVMAGGKLVQHVENHLGDHDVMTSDGRIFNVTSTHHQMQLPPPSAQVLAWAHPRLSPVHFVGPPSTNKTGIDLPNLEDNIVDLVRGRFDSFHRMFGRMQTPSRQPINCNPEKEYECAFYPNIRAIGMQSHPESAFESSEERKYCIELVKKFLLPASVHGDKPDTAVDGVE